MSSVPPNTPPGGGQPPYGSYDPKTQWRIYREQQKAAWRAQRDAFKAQRYAAKAGYYGGVYTPRTPSVVGPIILIGVGIVALLMLTGRIAAFEFWTWYAHWWPLLLIGAGLALLGEWALDLRSKTPVRRGGSFVGIIVLLAIIGLGAAGWDNWWGPFRSQFGDQSDDFFNSFGRPERDNDQQVLKAAIGANGSIEIQNPRGDVSITAGDGPNVEVQSHEVAYANSDSDARKIFDSEAAHLTVSGNAVVVKSASNESGRLNLTVTVPKSASVMITAGHGDVHLSSITGSVQVHFPNGRHDFSAHQIDGDLTSDGDINDFTLSEIKGKVTQTGEILGDVHVENVGGPIHLHTSITDLQVASLPGDLTLNSDDLRVTEAKGLVHVSTHSKDVDLSQIYGDTWVQDRDGRISVEPAGNYAVDAKNSKGDVEVSLAPSAAASVNAHTHNGDIVSDYPIPSTDEDDKTADFQVGSGGMRVSLTTDNGDIHIKKGSAFPAVPPPAATAAAEPEAPVAPKAPRLKTPKPLPPQPVTQ